MTTVTPPLVIDIFAGPGGWDTGLAMLSQDLRVVGVEWDRWACATAHAAGHTRVRADVARFDPSGMRGAQLLIASPPCQAWSRSGKRKGILDQEAIFRHAMRVTAAGQWIDYADAGPLDRGHPKADDGTTWHDKRSPLVLEVLRWVLAVKPANICLEQVPDVLPFWELITRWLKGRGYSVWCGTLSSERYGIIASCPLHETGSVRPARRSSAGPRQLATADPAGNGYELLLAHASTAEDRADFVRARVAVNRARTGQASTAHLEAACADAWTVASLARAVLDDASDATWRRLVTPRLCQTLDEMRILPGRAGAPWTSVDTSTSESTAAIAESIASSLSRLWADLCHLSRSYITSTTTQGTTTSGTSRSSAVTPITDSTTGSEDGKGSCGVCDDHAVPQTRERAILIASTERAVSAPPATHTAYDSRLPDGGKWHGTDGDLFGGGLEPWVSMAEALGWGLDTRPSPTVTSGGTETGGAEVFGNAKMRAAIRNGIPRAMGDVRMSNGTIRDIDHPAGTITASLDNGNHRWMLHTNHDQRPDGTRQVIDPSASTAPTLTAKSGGQWVYVNGTQANATRREVDEPAPTVMFSERSNKVEWEARDGGAVRVAVQEAAILQSFPLDYPWQGTKSAQFRQIGDAVPPLLAAHVIATCLGVQAEAWGKVAA